MKFIHRLTISTLGKISMRVLFLMEQKPAVLGIQDFPLRKADENKIVHKMKDTKKNYDNRAFDGELNVLGIKHPFSLRIFRNFLTITPNFPSISVVSISKGSCPSDLFTSTHACFNAFTLSYQRMQTSQQKLCCGLDVETLRALCR